MHVNLYINDVLAVSEEVNGTEALMVAERLEDIYRLKLLRACGVKTELAIENVESRMNGPYFLARREWYDDKYFKDHGR